MNILSPMCCGIPSTYVTLGPSTEYFYCRECKLEVMAEENTNYYAEMADETGKYQFDLQEARRAAWMYSKSLPVPDLEELFSARSATYVQKLEDCPCPYCISADVPGDEL